MCAATAAGGCITFSYLAWKWSLRGMRKGQEARVANIESDVFGQIAGQLPNDAS